MAIAVGTPEEVAAEPSSHTGQFLAELLTPAVEARRRRGRANARRGGRGGQGRRLSATAAQARLWAQKWRWYERNSLPWNRAQIHWQFLRREAFVRWPVHGNVLEALRERRLEIGAGVLLEPGVWITAPGRRACASAPARSSTSA